MRILLSLTVLLAAVVREVLTCSCLGPLTIESSLNSEETAVYVTVLEDLNPGGDQFRPRYYRATADRIIKGCGLEQYRQFYIKTTANGALCGVDLSINTKYLLFGSVTNEAIDGFVRAPQPVLDINLCQAHTALNSLDRSTMLNLSHRARPVCSTCFQNRDCWRSHGFGAVCNAGTCSPAPTRPPRPAPTYRPAPTPKSSINCETCPDGYYDGCNTCSCASNGGPGYCTLRYCSFTGRPSCRNRRPNPPSTAVNCQTCPGGYYDGCNSCSCRPDGTTGFCTQRYCYRKGTPRCRVPAVVRDKTTIDCSTCPNGYFDGCNNCMCGTGSTVGACTRRACPSGNIRPPSCN